MFYPFVFECITDKQAGLNLTDQGFQSFNSLLRCLVNEGAQKLGAKLYLPEMQFCGDNGAMVAAQGFYELTAGNVADLTLNGLATLPIDYNSPA